MLWPAPAMKLGAYFVHLLFVFKRHIGSRQADGKTSYLVLHSFVVLNSAYQYSNFFLLTVSLKCTMLHPLVQGAPATRTKRSLRGSRETTDSQ